MEQFDDKTKLELIDELEEHNLLFRTLWNTSDVFFTDTVKTAAVTFKDNKISFLFNRDFYESLPRKGQLFVVCHEQLHLVLRHFERLKFSEGDARQKNRAADVSVNHLLIRAFGFERTDIPNWQKYCWVDTVFDQPVPDNETAEFYYALLKQQDDQNEDNESGRGEPLDDHEYDSKSGERPTEEIKDILDRALNDHKQENTEGMTSEEVREWMDNFAKDYTEAYEQNLNTEGMGNQQQTHNTKRTHSRSWRSLYRSIPKRILATRTKQHWRQRDRRFTLLNDDFILPGTQDVEKEDRVYMHVYLDTSGSCIYHAKHFLESALSLPTKLYEIRLFGFGTRVYSLPSAPPYQLIGFGNESYKAVSDHVDDYIGVDAVVVFTDGYSKKVMPTHPHKWHWFITPNGTTEHIDPRCHTYDLTDFGWKGHAHFNT